MSDVSYFYHNGAFHHVEGDLPPGADLVPRIPNVGETWDPIAKEFVVDAVAVAHYDLAADHIDVVHHTKMAEAALVMSGFPLTHGFLAEEAAVVGKSIENLACLVLEKSKPLRDAEVARRLAKTSATS
jgi:hypothetical protein